MESKIQAFLSRRPSVKAAEIAAFLGRSKSEINPVLYRHRDKFSRDDDFKWSTSCPEELIIEFTPDRWIRAKEFEETLLEFCSPWHGDCKSVTFSLRNGCRIMLDALARLLALANQLHAAGKEVTLDFTDSGSTKSYLDRVGFFALLVKGVSVVPRRPRGQRNLEYQDNSDAVLEFRPIDPQNPNTDIPALLRRKFVACAGESYKVAAHTILSELFGNVLEHSSAEVPGFAGLQYYKGGNHIQAVISDGGLGIVGTLEPVLRKRYRELAEKIERSGLHPGSSLLQEVFAEGGISRIKKEGRGLGLRTSGEHGQKFRARISVRQKDFELRIRHTPEGRTFKEYLNLVPINGTHICFDFLLDGNYESR